MVQVYPSPAGAFMALVIDAAATGFAPRSLMALLDHPFALCGMDRADLSAAARLMEIAVLRGRLEPPDLAHLAAYADRRRQSVDYRSHRFVQNMDDDAWARVIDLAERLGELDPVHDRHVPVDDDCSRGFVALELVQGVLTMLGGNDLEPELGQHVAHHRSGRSRVIDHECLQYRG